MIANQRKFSFLPDLKMPLRDALRGVATFADATEDMLEPAARLLPEPMRSQFRHALEALEQAGKRLIHAPVDMAQIAAASRFITSHPAEDTDSTAAACVIVYAWEHLTQAHVDHRHLISETIVADRVSRLRGASALSGADFAASVISDLRHSSAIGLMPGLARGIRETEETEVDLALLAIGVWLASNRAETVTEEEKLLDLSMALVRALQPEAVAALGTPDALGHFLDYTSSHL